MFDAWLLDRRGRDLIFSRALLVGLGLSGFALLTSVSILCAEQGALYVTMQVAKEVGHDKDECERWYV